MSEMISQGRHAAVCSGSIQFGITGEGDNAKEQVVVQFVLNDETDPFNGNTISWFGFLNDKNFDRTIEALRVMGWEGDELAELPDLAATGGLNAQVEIVVQHEEYQGNWQAKVRWVNRPGGGAVKLKQPLEGTALAQFSQRMKGRVRAAGGTTKSTSTKPAAPPAPRANGGYTGGGRLTQHPNAPGSDDDIPF